MTFINPQFLIGIWRWTLDPLHFGSFVMPAILVVLATTVRWSLDLPFTSWADALLAFVAFDATAIVDSGTFRVFFHNPELANYVVGIHLFFLGFAFLAWIMLVWRAEKYLVPTHINGRVRFASFVAMGFGLIAVALLVTLHVAMYIA